MGEDREGGERKRGNKYINKYEKEIHSAASRLRNFGPERESASLASPRLGALTPAASPRAPLRGAASSPAPARRIRPHNFWPSGAGRGGLGVGVFVCLNFVVATFPPHPPPNLRPYLTPLPSFWTRATAAGGGGMGVGSVCGGEGEEV